jgi:hypothetical protein
LQATSIISAQQWVASALKKGFSTNSRKFIWVFEIEASVVHKYSSQLASLETECPYGLQSTRISLDCKILHGLFSEFWNIRIKRKEKQNLSGDGGHSFAVVRD